VREDTPYATKLRAHYFKEMVEKNSARRRGIGRREQDRGGEGGDSPGYILERLAPSKQIRIVSLMGPEN